MKSVSPDTAEEIFKHLISRGSTTALAAYGNWLFKRSRLQEAELFLREASEKRVNNSQTLLGKVLEKAGKLSDALAVYEEALSRGELHAAGRIEKIQRRIHMGSDTAPRSHERPSSAFDPTESESVLLGKVKESSSEEAERIFKHLIDEGSTPALVAYGNWLFKRGQLTEAENVLRKAVASEVDSVNSTLLLGKVLERSGKIREAATAYQEAIAQGSPHARVNLEKLEARISDSLSANPEERLFGGPATGDAPRLVPGEEEDPPAFDPESDDGVLVARAKKAPPHEAERIFQFLVARGSTTALVTYGNWLFRRGNLDEAERLLSEAGEQRVSQALICLGKVLERKGRLSEAQSSYEEAARRGDSHSLVALGKLHEKLRDFPAAEEAYKAAIRVGDAAEVPLGYLLEKMGEFGRAERIYEDAINNLDWAAVIPLGKLYARREEYEQEADLYEGVIGRASRSLPNNIPARLAGIREREGRLNDALNLYRLSLSMGNEDARSSVIRLEGEVAQAEE
ncbi:tetratricopeptide repeat protein [[Kitasatospora] papulosa]|uniref:tetratricopeptide repeat protein n=1 Tax=Streptomyces TaxID=1883 RepID=UPI00343D1237